MRSRSRRKSHAHLGLERLLELDGVFEGQKNTGYWIRIQVHRVRSSAGRPYGIKYSLTLHSPDGTRLIGFDNAHGIGALGKPSKRSAEGPAYDHWHYLNVVAPYQFRSGYQLLSDFYDEVGRFLQEVGDGKKH